MTNHQSIIIPQELIPFHCHAHVKSERELISLGSVNLKYLKEYWAREKEELSEKIEEKQVLGDMLSGKTIEDLKAMAKEYEYPVFSKIGVPDTSFTKDFAPLDEASLRRAAGTTTFNCCGWCKYCGKYIVGQGNCRIVTNCTLIPDEYNKTDFRFDSHCVIANGTQEFLELCVRRIESEIAEFSKKKEVIDSYLEYLTEAITKAEEKPCLVDCRPLDWFKVGDRVACFVPKDFGYAKQNIMMLGRVIESSRHGERIVVYADEEVEPGGYRSGHGLYYGDGRPEIMHEWEYIYFKNHPDFFKTYAEAIGSISDFDAEEMKKAMFD